MVASGLLAALLWGGCAARRPPVPAGPSSVPTPETPEAPVTPGAAVPAETPVAPEPAEQLELPEPTTEEPAVPPPEQAAAAVGPGPEGEPPPYVVQPEPALAPAEASEATAAAAPAEQPALRDLCRQGDAKGFIEESRRMLYMTFCGATLWFDGLFGGTPDLLNARAVAGRVELSALHTDFEGLDTNVRLRLNYDLPNLERRVRLFLGRDEPERFTADRQEGFAIRSAVFGLDQNDEWLAGLGYRPPGPYLQRVDFRIGGRIKSEPEVFVQSRYRRNVFLGRNDVWRLRETAFWENRDGFGSTTSLDWDRVLRRDLVVRWGNVGTISEVTEGLEWRSAIILYKNMRALRAVAGELFARGATDAEVKFRELGARAIYRQPLRSSYFFGDLIVGYTWPREERDKPREGSAMIGLGVELLFGGDPY